MKPEVQTFIDGVNKNMEKYNEDINLKMDQSDKLEKERLKRNPLDEDEFYEDEFESEDRDEFVLEKRIVTYCRSQEEFFKLTEPEKRLYRRLEDSNPIYHLIHDGCYDDINSIINFKTFKESNREYFQFDIADPLEFASNPVLIYSVKGSVFNCNNIENIIYTVSLSNCDNLIGIYIDRNTILKENVILNEISEISTSFNKVKPIKVYLTINKWPNEKDEKFIIDPQSQIYKLYISGKIDSVTFCNLVFFQAKENDDKQIKVDSGVNIVKKLSKKFI